MEPQIQYAKSGDLSIAFQVVGNGPLDLVWVPPFTSNLEIGWELPSYRHFFERLGSFSRVIIFDKRGTGLSDRVPNDEIPTLEERMDDIRAVMDHAGSKRAALFGNSEGSSVAAVFAATYPERTMALIAYSSFVGFSVLRQIEEPVQRFFGGLEEFWGQGLVLPIFAPARVGDEPFRRWCARYERMAASPGAAAALLRMNLEIDIAPVLPTIRVPTLVLHDKVGLPILADADRYLAQNIPGAKYVEVPGGYHWPWMGESDMLLDEVQEFLTGVRPGPDPDRVLATILFTDIVGSTETTADMGDRRWKELLGAYYASGRKELERFRGREVKTMGDGLLATFDGPARAIRCACAMREAARPLGIDMRAGLHTGECEVMGEDIAGIAVDIGARVAAEATAGEVLVSSTVKDLVAGAGIEFEDRGSHRLKGVPDDWRLFAVSGGA